MTKSSHFSALRELLLPWREVWGFSVLKSWDSMRSCMDSELLADLSRLDLSAQYQFLLGHELDQLTEPLAKVQQQLTLLTKLPRVPLVERMKGPFEEGLTPKKNHEISQILAFLDSRSPIWEQLLDVGGGAGHLARHIAARWPLETLSVDREALFQEEGHRLLRRRPWKVLVQKPFLFLTGSFPECMRDKHSWNPLRSTLSVGLHTCGPLAWEHLQLVSDTTEVLNFGCCYDKLQLDKDVERSTWAKKHPLGWTNEALFLVTRGGKERGYEDFQFQYRVQLYRFALHHLLQNELGLEEFVSVGQTASRHYQGSFAAYVNNRLAHMKIDSSISDLALEDFFRDQRTLLEEQWLAALLRNRLARPLELLLLLDRALAFEEQGYVAELYEFFDPQLSPRNLGIFLRGI